MAICVEVPVLVHFLESLDLVILGALEVRVLERLAKGPDIGAEGGQLQSVHHSPHRNGALGPSLGSGARKASTVLRSSRESWRRSRRPSRGRRCG